jgi:hypothetical protein
VDRVFERPETAVAKGAFPKGVTFADGIYKTPETCLIFKMLQESEVEKTSLATLPGIENGFDFLRESERTPYDSIISMLLCVSLFCVRGMV